MYLGRLLLHIISATVGLFIAVKIIPGVDFYGTYKMLVMVGIILGLANFFIKPILKAISLPVVIITLGFFSIIINMALVWLIADVAFPEVLEISGIISLFWTTLIIWALSFILGLNRK